MVILIFLLTVLATSPPLAADASLKLETIVDPLGPYYPGQRARFGYRIFFNQPTALTSEILPLLEPEGFEKIGQPTVTETNTPRYSVQEIIQAVRAQKPGSYSLPVSQIQGYSFVEDAAGKQQNTGSQLQAETSPIQLSIRPFPEKGQPASFTGLIGAVTLETELLSSPTVLVGDELRFLIRIGHLPDVEELTPPDLRCQPGFSGFFQFSDFPPNTHTDAEFTTFTYTIRPLSPLITAIPAVEAAYFDPQSETYATVHSLEIPIMVSSAPLNQSLASHRPISQEIKPPPPQPPNTAEQMQNQALRTLLQQEQSGASAALYEKIGSHFFSLGQYGWAILYYRRALALEPRSHPIEEQLKQAHRQLGIPEPVPTFRLPLSEREKLFFALLLFLGLFLMLSALVWKPKYRLIHLMAAPLAILFVAICADLLYDHYGATLEAVVVRSTLLYTAPRQGSSDDQTLLEGTAIKVLDTTDQGHWLKVRLPDGRQGYVAYASVRII